MDQMNASKLSKDFADDSKTKQNFCQCPLSQHVQKLAIDLKLLQFRANEQQKQIDLQKHEIDKWKDHCRRLEEKTDENDLVNNTQEIASLHKKPWQGSADSVNFRMADDINSENKSETAEDDTSGDLTEEINSLKMIINSMQDNIFAVSLDQQMKFETLATEISNLTIHLANISTFISGRLTWSIDNFTETFKKLKSDKTFLQSKSFFSKPSGYKMFLRINFDSNDVCILSLWLMKGDFDCILKWPAQWRGRFIIVDQADEINHLVYDFCTGLTDKPKDSCSVRGVCKFIPFSELRSDKYLINDSVVVRVLIDIDH